MNLMEQENIILKEEFLIKSKIKTIELKENKK